MSAGLAARRERAELRAQEGERAREVELLRIGLAEVERVAPVEHEDHGLDRELSRLAAADELRSASETARLALAGGFEAPSDDGGAVAALAFAARSLEAAGANDPELAGLSARAHEVCVIASELAAELSSYAAAVDDDPLRLAAAQERRAELNRLCRPHGTDVDGVLAMGRGSRAPARTRSTAAVNAALLWQLRSQRLRSRCSPWR